MAKKEKTSEELVMDLVTKLKTVFKKDIYIKDKLYIYSGTYSDEDLCGDMICVLEPKYKLAVEDYFADSMLIYIDDVSEFKKEPSSHTEYIKDSAIIDELVDVHNAVIGNIEQVDDWKCFSTNSQETLEKLFVDNASVDFVENEDMSYVTLCKKLFPLVTMKNVENLFYAIRPFMDDMNVMCLDFHFTHFRIYALYYFLNLKKK